MSLEPWRELVDLERLAGWMDTQGLESGPLLDATPLSGGSQNVLLKFRRGERSFVLRRPPANPHMNGNDTMRKEARMLAGIADSDVPHARLIAACGDEAVLGAAFYLMEPVEGFPPTVALPEPYLSDASWRRRMGFALVDGAAALHRVDHVKAGLGDMGKVEGFLERQVSRWRGQLESYGKYEGWSGIKEIPDVDRIAKWLDDNRPASFKPGILHGDYHFANVMFRYDEPQIAAIVDWELSTIGDPMLDLGWVLATWPDEKGPGPGAVGCTPWTGFPQPEELVARYAQNTERDMSMLDWYVVLACFKLGIILEGTHARASAGKAAKETGDYLHAATINLFTRASRLCSAPAI